MGQKGRTADQPLALADKPVSHPFKLGFHLGTEFLEFRSLYKAKNGSRIHESDRDATVVL